MDNIILAIETSIKAGSLALLDGARVIDSWTGNNEISRSEDLLPEISRLLDKNQIKLGNLKKIAVSTGPGSFTGIRIGIATAKALALVLDCPLISVSILEALATIELSKTEKFIVVVSAGRDLYFWQKFQGYIAVADVATGDASLLASGMGERETILIAEQIAYDNLFRNDPDFSTEITSVAGNFAEQIGRCSLDKDGKSDEVLPLYIRNAVMTKK